MKSSPLFRRPQLKLCQLWSNGIMDERFPPTRILSFSTFISLHFSPPAPTVYHSMLWRPFLPFVSDRLLCFGRPFLPRRRALIRDVRPVLICRRRRGERQLASSPRIFVNSASLLLGSLIHAPRSRDSGKKRFARLMSPAQLGSTTELA